MQRWTEVVLRRYRQARADAYRAFLADVNSDCQDLQTPQLSECDFLSCASLSDDLEPTQPTPTPLSSNQHEEPETTALPDAPEPAASAPQEDPEATALPDAPEQVSPNAPVPAQELCGALTTRGTNCRKLKPCPYHKPPEPPALKVLCGQTTTKGKACTKTIPCPYHKVDVPPTEEACAPSPTPAPTQVPAKELCGAMTTKGKPCKKNKPCPYH